MKIFCILITSLILSNFCSAEIIKTHNPFDNSSQFISLYKNRISQYPQTLIFKKYGNDYYLLGKKPTRMINYLSNLENPKIKIDEKYFSLDCRIYDYNFYQNFSFKFTDEVIKEILSANSIMFQMPTLIHNKDIFIDYYQFSIPQNVLDEWKQVIAME